MAKVFLDTNVFIDFVEKRTEASLSQFLGHEVFISPLSIHILAYTYKYKIPDDKLINFLEKHANLQILNEVITGNALLNPTTDFEDNVQLHSAAQADCEFFLTSDAKLLKMKFFGKAKIVETLQD